jgi:hypothetical protein
VAITVRDALQRRSSAADLRISDTSTAKSGSTA